MDATTDHEHDYQITKTLPAENGWPPEIRWECSCGDGYWEN
ncbi:hypothetical protein [Kineosporia corallincola]|nr:hypothetical protein [Kineosporia corallincola]